MSNRVRLLLNNPAEGNFRAEESSLSCPMSHCVIKIQVKCLPSLILSVDDPTLCCSQLPSCVWDRQANVPRWFRSSVVVSVCRDASKGCRRLSDFSYGAANIGRSSLIACDRFAAPEDVGLVMFSFAETFWGEATNGSGAATIAPRVLQRGQDAPTFKVFLGGCCPILQKPILQKPRVATMLQEHEDKLIKTIVEQEKGSLMMRQKGLNCEFNWLSGDFKDRRRLSLIIRFVTCHAVAFVSHGC